jgi:hypothetical protein
MLPPARRNLTLAATPLSLAIMNTIIEPQVTTYDRDSLSAETIFTATISDK